MTTISIISRKSRNVQEQKDKRDTSPKVFNRVAKSTGAASADRLVMYTSQWLKPLSRV
ncbi:predicted protein [Botrytis cinerea T4]|uniref:Uncharacterized protein n=1 Tax=Botryotinia fuckeliana (strain T4) TaxID=999810 RepID=G2YLP4_BOTF4|nr:predicted protein [Botrytis cinerea T4]